MDWARRFEAFCWRKEQEAASARISPFATVLERPSSTLERIGNEWSRLFFDGWFYQSPEPSPERAGGSLVFVQSRDGNTAARDPSTLGGGEADKHLVYEGLSRVAAHGVLAGAGTVRGGDVIFSVWHPEMIALRASLGMPRHPVQIVTTVRGVPLDRTLLYNVPELPVIVVTVPPGLASMQDGLARRPWITPIVMETAGGLRGAFDQIRQLGIRRVSAIGGRTVAAALIDAGLVHDIYLTTSPRRGGEPNTPFYSKPLTAATVVWKRGTGADAGVMFEHLTFGAGPTCRAGGDPPCVRP
jgi:5-amino-6-(5-phosphoribosylamino)uracil reductase